MRQGKLSACSNSVDMLARLGNGPAVPTIVFQGDPRNADYVIAQCRTTKLQEKIHRGRCLEDMHTPARSIPTRTGVGREVAPPAHTPIRAKRELWVGSCGFTAALGYRISKH